MKDIAFIINGPVGNKGGVETFNYYLIRDLLYFNNLKIYSTSRKSEELGVEYVKMYQIPFICQKYRHVFLISSLYYGLVNLIPGRGNCRKVQILHGFRPFISEKRGLHFFLDPLKAFYSYSSILCASNFSDVVISNSYITKAFYLRMFNLDSIVIPIFFKSVFSGISDINYNFDKSFEYDLLFVGRLNHVKNILFFMDLVSILEKKFGLCLKVCIVGDGPLFGYVGERIKGLQSLVHLRRTMPNKDVKSFMLRSHILVVPTFIETFGLVVSEGLACGMKVFASKYCGIVDFLPNQSQFDNLRILCLEPLKDAEWIYSELKNKKFNRSTNISNFRNFVEKNLFVSGLLNVLGVNKS